MKKLTANAFAQKLLASSPNVMPLHLDNDSSNSVWLENWSDSRFWTPIPQPKRSSVKETQKKFVSNSQNQIVEAEFARLKKSVRKVPTSNLNSLSAAQTSYDFEIHKRSFRKVSTSQSVEPLAMENAQVDLEKVKRGLRKVHNPVVGNSIQPQPVPQITVEKPNLCVEESVSAFDGDKEDEMAETLVEQRKELIQTHGPLETNETLDTTLVNQIEESEENVMTEEKEGSKEEKIPKQSHKENSGGKENQKSRKKGSPVTTTQTAECQDSNGNQSPRAGIPSYMQATKSAKAKLRLQGSTSPKKQVTTEKASRRYSLPSSGNSARVTSDSPRTARLLNSGGKTGNKTEKTLISFREGKGKTATVEWKR